MNSPLPDLLLIVLIGIGATAVLDLWLALLKRLGVQTLNFAFVGRWIGHLLRGRSKHDAIAKSPPIPGETMIGWLVHYAIGIAFAGVLAGVVGTTWIRSPTPLPALLVGVGTVIAPLFVMQPAMGAGIASSRTPAPVKNCVRSVINHTVFGAGLYVAAVTLHRIFPMI
jgi:Protein of unknown function (DUF2938)